jgi:hypothetical protein
MLGGWPGTVILGIAYAALTGRVAEAGLSVGRVLVPVDDSIALTIALTHRLCITSCRWWVTFHCAG